MKTHIVVSIGCRGAATPPTPITPHCSQPKIYVQLFKNPTNYSGCQIVSSPGNCCFTIAKINRAVRAFTLMFPNITFDTTLA